MLITTARNNPRAIALLAFLILLNLLVWVLALVTFSHSVALIATCLLAWGYGLRHAVDADHIAAIDNVTRKMMQQNKRPFGVGAWFSLGHSTIVILASLGIAITAAAMQKHLSWFQDVGGAIGTAVSALFLLIMAIINLVILYSVWQSFQKLKRGESLFQVQPDQTITGPMNWLYRGLFRFINRSWHMYFVGFLFGLGFDTATEVGVLGMSATSATQGMNVWSIMVFPLLFTAGMALIDTLDNVLMVGAYGWAFNKPQRKLYYNITITATSVVVAVFIGGIEALGLLADQLNLRDGFWNMIGSLNDNLGNAGFVVIGLFIVCWIISFLNYRWKNYDQLSVN